MQDRYEKQSKLDRESSQESDYQGRVLTSKQRSTKRKLSNSLDHATTELSKRQSEVPTKKSKRNKRQEKDRCQSKCCKKRCLYVLNSEVGKNLNQEYKEQARQSYEHGRSYIRKYIYPSKKKTNSDGSRRPVIYHYRVPQRIACGDNDAEIQKMEICHKAALKIFDVSEKVLHHVISGKCSKFAMTWQSIQ